jgi:CDP-glucose 4,6-dehydratase
MKVIVTGGSGFLGTNLINKLTQRKNYSVFSIDKKKLNKDTIFSYEKVDNFDLNLNSRNLINILKEINPDIIFNLAAESQVLRSADNPLDTYKSNIFGSLNLFDSIRKLQINPKIIHASTDKVYGISDNLPYREDHKLYSNFTYDISKISADLIAQNYKEIYGLDITLFRSCNIYGPADFNYDRLIPHIVKSFIRKKPPIFRSNGKYLREYIYVEDLIEYIIMLTRNRGDEYIFNLGSGDVLSVNEVYENISSYFDETLKPVVLNNDLNEIPEQKIDSKKFTKIYNPKFALTNFGDGISKTISWYKDFYQN